MAKKVYTIEVEDKKLESTTKAKRVRTVKSKAEKEVESFGIVEINNASATSKVKNKTDKGFEKNIVGTTQKSVKQQVNEVEDYFDFCFKVEEKKEPKAKTVKKTLKEKKIDDIKETCKAECLDAEAYVIMNLARMGSLFGCDARAIN